MFLNLSSCEMWHFLLHRMQCICSENTREKKSFWMNLFRHHQSVVPCSVINKVIFWDRMHVVHNVPLTSQSWDVTPVLLLLGSRVPIISAALEILSLRMWRQATSHQLRRDGWMEPRWKCLLKWQDFRADAIIVAVVCISQERCSDNGKRWRMTTMERFPPDNGKYCQRYCSHPFRCFSSYLWASVYWVMLGTEVFKWPLTH